MENDYEKDDLRTPGNPDRVCYEYGALLDREDYRREQSYHRSRLARALACLHGEGTVAGLMVKLEEDVDLVVDWNLMVEPGVAVDRLGRLIEVPRTWSIKLKSWYDQQLALGPAGALAKVTDGRTDITVDLFVSFHQCAFGKQPVLVDDNFRADGSIAPSRLRDAFRFDLVVQTTQPPPVPASVFPAPEADKLGQLKKWKYEKGWNEYSAFTDEEGRITARPWHVEGQDGTELLLARLTIRRTAGTFAWVGVVDDVNGIDNDVRQFSYATAELLWLLGK